MRREAEGSSAAKGGDEVTTQTRAAARDVGDMVGVAQMPLIAQGTPTEEQFERIRSFGVHNDTIRPEQLFVFEMIASGDGLDFYATRQGESSMKNYERDLQFGQSLLASHDIGLLSYGQSFMGRQMDADPLAPWYESTFFRKWDRPELRTSKVVVGTYFVPRGLELNRQKTDDIIASLQFGNIRKASISFVVGGYTCSIDGRGMLDSFMGPLPDGVVTDSDDACLHFPGEEYEGQIGYAWMHECSLLETSLVYKNASPSAMLVRKAEEMAKRGVFTTAQVARVEERLARRLPSFEPRVWATGEQEVRMTELEGRKPETTEEETEVTTEQVEEEAEEQETETPQQLADRSVEAIASRETEIRSALGVETLGEQSLRELAEDAQLGRSMYAATVEEAVKARVRTVGPEKFGKDAADKYRRSLLSMRDPEYVLGEVGQWGGESPFKGGRQVAPSDLPTDEREHVAPLPPVRHDPWAQPAGLFGGLSSGRSPQEGN